MVNHKVWHHASFLMALTFWKLRVYPAIRISAPSHLLLWFGYDVSKGLCCRLILSVVL